MPVYAGPDAELDLVGTLDYQPGGAPESFRYAATWCARHDQFPLSPLLAPARLEAMDAEQRAQALSAFLLGLLPAGKPLTSLTADLRRRDDDIAGILSTGGGVDTAGALRFGRPLPPPPSDPFGADTLREVPLNELSRRIAWRDSQSLQYWDHKVHSLLPGTRDKLALHIVDERRSLVVADRVASTHVIKVGGAERTCSSLSANELFMSRLTAGCGLPTAEVSMLKLDCGPALQIRRFDRQRRPRGNSIHRLHVISGWQLLGLPPQPINAPVEVRQAWLTALLRAVRAHAADPRAERVRELDRTLELDALERRARRRPLGSRPLAPIERDYRAALDREPESPAACATLVEALLTVHGHAADPHVSAADHDLWLALASRQFERLQPLVARERAEDTARARATLDQAAALAKEAAVAEPTRRQALVAKRTELLESIVEIYGERPHMAEIVARTKQLVADSSPSPATPAETP